MAKKKKFQKKRIHHNIEKVKEKKINPFDLKINRKKYDIIGQKKTHNGIISKNKIQQNQNRKEFLKKVNLHRNKANGFIDKRIGEYDSDMLKEDRIMARLAASQRKQHKKSLYNLNDEFDLTHGGQPISTLETFDDVKSDTDDEDDNDLNKDFVNDAHFGGFLTKKNDNTSKTHKEILNELIIESKKKKQERKETKDLTDDLTSKLDEEWKQVHFLLPNMKDSDVTQKTNYDSFDVAVKELKFEPRGNPILNVKNEEIENEKKRKKLEEERISRMNCLNLKQKCLTNFSADALDENFKLIDITSENIEDSQLNNLNNVDLQNDDEDMAIEFTGNHIESEDDSISNTSAIDLEGSELLKNLIDEHSSTDLMHLPQTIEDLSDLISDLNSEEMISKLDMLITKCRFKSDAETTCSVKFFNLLLKFIDTKYGIEETDENILIIVAPRLFILTQKSPLETGKIFKSFLLEKILHYQEIKSTRTLNFNILIILKLCGYMYSVSDFHHPVVTLAMNLISNILTSCFHPTFRNIIYRLFICQVTYEYVIHSKRFVPEAVNYLFSLLSLATIKENPLSKVTKKLTLHTSTNKKILCVSSNIKNWELVQFLQLVFKSGLDNVKNDENVLSIIYYTFDLLHKFSILYKDIPIFSEFFHSTIDFHSYLPIKNYPAKLVVKIKDVQAFISDNTNCKQALSFPIKKPKPLKLFTPRFEEHFGKEHVKISDKLKVHKQLSKKIKNEEKGIIREIRRDAEFEARERLKGKLSADAERKRKVKALYSQLASQENDYKNLTKKFK